ncbi:phosphonate C-P lyase system protein PhnH [Okeania sp. SIO3I5]|uniref:phosphonate C-P lyase system protein PhnH n=1 Tax=Okeania sp. SIO3I5 TaxID=2607805 RepID=UPI0025FCD5A2|nr:phosphonate C-P lyase system protein PhnH [Okeania sp. SIO3I5]
MTSFRFTEFRSEWETNLNNYPLGIDIFFFVKNTVIGLPRTTKISKADTDYATDIRIQNS